ncbi:MAG: ABC transporter ATP-binding protein [Elusimicrobiota bacterium]
MSIKIENLSKTFRIPPLSRDVFRDISLNLEKGEVFALTGPNGSGKTTLLKILATLVLPTRGTASVCGHSILEEPGMARRALGLIYDTERGFYQTLTLMENLVFYARLFGLSGSELRARADKFIELFRLKEWEDTPLSKCSSGIKQRAAVARALILEPRVLLIDEISKSLDAESQKTLQDYVKEYVKKNSVTCIIVTHDMEEAKLLADRTGRLENGSLI